MHSSLTGDNKIHYKRKVIVLIAFFSLVKIVIASSIDLGNDESYYWLYSQALKWNYFDHPPMVAIWIRLFTANLLLEKYVLFLRLGSIVGCGLSTWCMYKCVSTLASDRAGWFAACLYNASFYASVTAGIFIFPDSPQMVFYTFSLWMIAKITQDETKWIPWLLFGIGTGLCIMSKVHGIFLWLGLGMYVLVYKRNWLLNVRLYTALLLALIITCPILIWNIQHDFLTYRFNSERIVIKGFSLNWHSFLMALLHHFIVNNPFNVVIILLAFSGWRRQKIATKPAILVFNFIGISFVLLLLIISLYRFTLPHWSGPAYIALLPAAGIWLAAESRKLFYPKLIVFALSANLIFLTACTLTINYYPGTLGSKIEKELGKGDISLDMYGWQAAGKQFAVLYQKELTNGTIKEGAPVICNTWWGAHDEYYFCRAAGIQMIGLGSMYQLHEYMWMNTMRKNKVDMSTAYCIIHSDENYDVYTEYKNFYSRADTAAIIQVPRNKKTSHVFYVLRLEGWKGHVPVAPE